MRRGAVTILRTRTPASNIQAPPQTRFIRTLSLTLGSTSSLPPGRWVSGRQNDVKCDSSSQTRGISSNSFLNQQAASHSGISLSMNSSVSPGTSTQSATPAPKHESSSSSRQHKASRTPTSASQPITPSNPTSIPAPSSPLAIVFTDVVKSTDIWESDTQAMASAMATHDAIIRHATTACQGYEVKQNGDGFMIAFPAALAALTFCLRVQQALLDATWPAELLKLGPGRETADGDGTTLFRGLRLRMSAHWGGGEDVVCVRNEVIGRMDYLGPMVNRAARFIQASEGGQIVVSEEFLDELGRQQTPPDGPGGRSGLGPGREKSTGSALVAEAGDHNPLQPEGRAGAVVADLEDLRLSSQSQPLANAETDATDGAEGENADGVAALPIDREFEVRLLGKHRFKGIEEPQKLYFIIPRSLRGRLDHWPKHTHVAGSKGNLVPE